MMFSRISDVFYHGINIRFLSLNSIACCYRGIISVGVFTAMKSEYFKITACLFLFAL